MDKKRILVADDHAVVRRGLVDIIQGTSSMEVTAEACSGFEAVNLVSRQDFDIVVLDISMPGPSGLDVLKNIREIRPNLPVLILSIHPEEQYALRVLKAGAWGYLTKDSAPAELLEALRLLASGRKYITSSVAEKMAGMIGGDGAEFPHEKLSDREFQVLRLIAQGKTVKEIALKLFLSEKTVSTYRTRILEKMNMKTNSEMIHYAFKNHLVE